MRPALLSDLRCPACGGPLRLQPSSETPAGVEEGFLLSACGRLYPLIGGIPRRLPEDLRAGLERDHPGFFTRHADPRLRPLSASTRAAFGDEWLRFPEVHALSWLVAAATTVFFILPRRGLRRFSLADALTRRLPLAQFTDVPFRMLVAEQLDRFVAPIEARYRRLEVEARFEDIGFNLVSLAPGLGWRAIARRPRSEGPLS